MNKPNKVDKLFALEAVRKKVVEAIDELKSECSWELEAAYENEGTTQRRSQYFGKDAGSFSIVFSSAQPEHEEVTYRVTDMTALAKWCDENRLDVDTYVQATAEQFTAWLVEQTGEIPSGIERQACLVEAAPEQPKGTRLAVKPDVIFANMGANLFEEVNTLLLGGGDNA